MNILGKWGPREMIKAIEGVAWALKDQDGVCGCAATGSFTRFEFPCGDLDVVILHNGQVLPDTSTSYPTKNMGEYGKQDIPLSDILRPSVFRNLPKTIPTDYIFVREDALWDCAYLQSLKRRERFTDFYLRIFTDPEIPIVLFRTPEARGRLRKFLEGNPLFGENSDWFRVRHSCYNPLCKPKQTWAEARHEMAARKGILYAELPR